MARFLFFTWSGGGNQPPAIGIAQELRERGHTVRFAGDASQRARLTDLGLPFTLLARSSATRDPRLTDVVAGVMASHEHLVDVPDAVRGAQDDVLVIDCLMFGALAAAELAGWSVAVLVHSAPGLLGEPHGWLEGFLLEAVNGVRAAAGLAPVAALWDVWARFPTLCATIPALDPLAARVPASFAYVGPAFEHVPPSGWLAPWPADDPRPLVLVSFSTIGAWDQASRIRRTLEGVTDICSN